MRETPYLVQVADTAHLRVRQLPDLQQRTKARQSLINRQPFPARFATYSEAETAARKAGPEFEVVVQS